MDYRIQNKQNEHIGQRPVTGYQIFIYDPAQHAFVWTARGWATGHNASDVDCFEDYLRHRDDNDDA